MKQISFIITAPYYDSGIKSLGSKCIYSVKKNTILEKQYKTIVKSCEDIEYEIILVNNIDHIKTTKFLENKNLDIQYIYLNQKNTNHAGCFLKGLQLAKYNTVFNIECGLILSSAALSSTINNSTQSDINVGCIGNKHKQNQDLEIGCVINNHSINNIFFGLENKYIGINCINEKAKKFILDNFTISQDKNKYMFELINSCIAQNLVCKKTDLKSKDTHLIFNKKSLQQYTGSP
jgi:hypothetical protein